MTPPVNNEQFHALPDEAVPIGYGVHIATTYTEEGRFSGVIVYHYHEREGWCAGWIPVLHDRAGPGVYWSVRSMYPLTLEPSIRRPHCGLHGFIRDGKWSPCDDCCTRGKQ